MPKKTGITTIIYIEQTIGQVINPTMDMMEIIPKVIGIIDFILFPLRN